MKLTPEEVRAAVAAHGSIRKAAGPLGVDERTLRRILKAEGAPSEASSTLERKGEEELRASVPAGRLGDVSDLIKENGLDPADWIIVGTTLKKWDGPVKGGGTQPLRYVSVTLRKRPELVLPTPTPVADVIPALRTVRRAGNMPAQPVGVDRPRLIVVEGDHQAPYFDPELDAAATAFIADLQPDEHVFLGDLLDLPTASRHADHPSAQATPQECVDAGYGILRRRAEAAPNARRRFLKGNHDWRLESYLLDHAAKFYGLRPAGSDVPALGLRHLLNLDALGVELVEDSRGWDHAEVELVPGQRGLVVRHGWITGANTAGRSLSKRGRSMLVGHGHGREHAFQWDPSAEVERQAAMLGTMSRSRDSAFPHFAVLDAWLQGFATVTVWPDGAFIIEHARWQDGALYWRDRRWTP